MLFIDRQFETAADDPDRAVKRVVLLVLKSPRFLYPDAGISPEQYAIAARLAFALWDAPPDRELLATAAASKLGTREEIARQAERMLTDPRAKAFYDRGYVLYRQLYKDLKRSFAAISALVDSPPF